MQQPRRLLEELKQQLIKIAESIYSSTRYEINSEDYSVDVSIEFIAYFSNEWQGLEESYIDDYPNYPRKESGDFELRLSDSNLLTMRANWWGFYLRFVFDGHSGEWYNDKGEKTSKPNTDSDKFEELTRQMYSAIFAKPTFHPTTP